MSANLSIRGQSLRTPWLRTILACASLTAIGCSASTKAATITVNSLLDDVFPDAAGVIAIPLVSSKCTLRMAIASANLDLPVGGATNGCVAASGTAYLTAGADTVVFDPALFNGTIMLDATQAMSVTGVTATTSILYITGPTTVDGNTATSITLDGGFSGAMTTSKRIMIAAEVAPSGGETRAGSSIWVNVYGIKFQNARVENAGGCLLAFENLRLFTVDFTNCISTNTPTTTGAAGGALFMRAPDNVGTSFRPDARLTRVTFKGNKALAGGNASNPGG